MKKIIFKLVIVLCLTIGISFLVFFLKTEKTILANKEQQISIIFILFGFILTCYTFIVSILKKLSKNSSEIENFKRKYLKELQENLLGVFFLGLAELILDLFYNANFIKAVIKHIFDYFTIFVFILTILLVIDTIISIFIIIRLSLNEEDGEKKML